ncbi:MAG: ABC transporter ATP-binding protein [Nitrososphaera sp.]|nr:ABC transporter ATP-binding protein [Nitrososphaera sp.]
MAGTPLLELISVSKDFDTDGRHVRALEDITLSINKGEFVSLIGPSGCGKTTILRLAAGLEQPSSGEALYDGNKVAGPGPERGLVFQAYTAFPWLTVRENIAFGLDRSATELYSDRVAEWLERTGLREFSESYPKTLSGGMRQRMALARTMIVEPKLLLMDEPMGALDQRTREKLQLFVLQVVSETHCTAILVTHDIREAILLSDRIFVMSARPGRVVHEIISDLPKPRTHHQCISSQFELIYDRVVKCFPE